jgi:hypothetical protein
MDAYGGKKSYAKTRGEEGRQTCYPAWVVKTLQLNKVKQSTKLVLPSMPGDNAGW